MSAIIKGLTIPSPLQELRLLTSKKKKLRVLIKRDDLIHPWLSGNKYRKLKYNLLHVKANNIDTILTFGGAYSNHLHATAGACALAGINSIGIIRGEIDKSNPTLKFCIEQGMKLISVSRTAYRNKENAEEIQEILHLFPEAYTIPEGGSNKLALKGASEIMEELTLQLGTQPDHIVLSCGTGGTTAGLLTSDNLSSCVLAFSALKSSHLKDEINLLSDFKNADKLTVNTNFHFGGYAKWETGLIQFINDFESEYDIPLDHVYNGKAMYGLMELIRSDYFESGSTICYIHTGGLQGKEGLKYTKNK